MNHESFSVGLVWLKNAFGEAMEIYRAAPSRHAEPVTLSSEDVMMMNVMLSSEPAVYKLLLMNARRLLDEEYFGLSVVTAAAGLDAFLNALLRSSLNSDQLLDYTSIERLLAVRPCPLPEETNRRPLRRRGSGHAGVMPRREREGP